MAKIVFPPSLNLPDQMGMTRSVKECSKRWPYELKITLDDVLGVRKNMYIGLNNTDMRCILYHLKALGLITSYREIYGI